LSDDAAGFNIWTMGFSEPFSKGALKEQGMALSEQLDLKLKMLRNDEIRA
jgi:hypothetical protein